METQMKFTTLKCTGSDSTINDLIEDDNQIQCGVIESYENLKAQLEISNIKPSSGGQGTFNKVENFVKTKLGNITLRVGKDPTNYLINKLPSDSDSIFATILRGSTNNEYIISQNIDARDEYGYVLERSELEDELNENIATKNNWLIANQKNLCPKIYFYGFVKKSNQLYSLMVSESYQADMLKYYTKGNGRKLIYYSKDAKNFDSNSAIASQLSELLSGVSAMQLICFDIKPPNAVINENEDGTHNVKLIDWDADWCQNYNNVLRTRDTSVALNQQINIINNLVMASLFYEQVGYNIYYDYIQKNYFNGYVFNENGTVENSPQYEALKHLYCKMNSPEGGKNQFYFMGKHYLHSEEECGELFDKIVKIASTIRPKLSVHNKLQELLFSGGKTTMDEEKGIYFLSIDELENGKFDKTLNLFFYISASQVNLCIQDEKKNPLLIKETDTKFRFVIDAFYDITKKRNMQNYAFVYDNQKPYILQLATYDADEDDESVDGMVVDQSSAKRSQQGEPLGPNKKRRGGKKRKTKRKNKRSIKKITKRTT